MFQTVNNIYEGQDMSSSLTYPRTQKQPFLPRVQNRGGGLKNQEEARSYKDVSDFISKYNQHLT